MQINTAMSTIILASLTLPCASAYLIIPELSTFDTRVTTSFKNESDYTKQCLVVSTACDQLTGPITVTMEKTPGIVINTPNPAQFGYTYKDLSTNYGTNYPVKCELVSNNETQIRYSCPPFNSELGKWTLNGVYIYYLGEQQFEGSVSKPTSQEMIANLIASEKLSQRIEHTETIKMFYEANGIRLESYSSLRGTTVSTVSTRITIQVDAPGEINMPLCVVGKPCVTTIPVQVRSNLRDHDTRINASFVNLPTGDSGVINNDTNHTSPVITTSFYGVANYNLDTTINTLNHGENTYYIKITATLN